VYQNVAKPIICEPIVLIFLHVASVKQSLFLSNHIIHKTTPLTVSIRIVFKEMEQSKYHKSYKQTPKNLKLLCLAIHCQIKLTKGRVTKR
jgi:hypothetical protein